VAKAAFRLRLASAGLIILAAASSAVAGEPSVSGLDGLLKDANITGSLRADYFRSSTGLDDRSGFAGTTLQVKALPSLSSKLDGKFEARLMAPDLLGRKGTRPDAQLLEGYLVWHLPGVDLRLGKQNVAWGRTDGINPTDNLTPRNYRVMLPYDEDQRFGIWGLKATAALPNGMTLSLFASPDFKPDKVPLPASGLAVIQRRPAHSLGNMVLGAKLDRSSEKTDWSLSYYHGPGLLPTAEVAGTTLVLGFDRTNVLGFDFARNFGRFGFRSELAYTFSDTASLDPNAARGRFYWVAGFDRTFGENLNLNVQGLVRWMPGRDVPQTVADPSARGAAILNSIVRGQERSISSGLTFRVSDLWLHNTLRAELFGIINAPSGDFYLRPLVNYDISDKVRLSAGANIYAGPRTTQFGAQRPNSGLFVELRRGF